MRNLQKAFLTAFLLPKERLTDLQDKAKYTELLALGEELKTYPYGDVWRCFCERNGVPAGEDWLGEVLRYEEKVLSQRGR
jgi:L-rhamnose isomerase